MDTRPPSAESPYEAALAEERLYWQRLQRPPTDVNEQIRACAEWSAAADRARSIAERAHQPAAQPK